MRKAELNEAASLDEGVCLTCGEIVEFVERRLLLGLCPACGEQDVVEAALALRIVEILNGESNA